MPKLRVEILERPVLKPLLEWSAPNIRRDTRFLLFLVESDQAKCPFHGRGRIIQIQLSTQTAGCGCEMVCPLGKPALDVAIAYPEHDTVAIFRRTFCLVGFQDFSPVLTVRIPQKDDQISALVRKNLAFLGDLTSWKLTTEAAFNKFGPRAPPVTKPVQDGAICAPFNAEGNSHKSMSWK